jgi:hypothetical protein
VGLWVRPGAYHRVKRLKDALVGQAPALLTNIRQDWQGMLGTNILVYYKIRKLERQKHSVLYVLKNKTNSYCHVKTPNKKVQRLINFQFLAI